MSNDEPQAVEAYPDELYIAIGKYIREWSTMEALVLASISPLSGMDVDTVYAVYDRTDITALIKTCRKLAQKRLKQPDQKLVLAWLKIVDTARIERNEIMHGAWLEKVTAPGQTAPALYSTRFKDGELEVHWEIETIADVNKRRMTISDAWAAYEQVPTIITSNLNFPAPHKKAPTTEGISAQGEPPEILA